VSELPPGWVEATLSDIADVIAGQSPPGTSYNSDGEGFPLFQGKTDFGDLYLGDPRVWTTSPSKIAAKDDILLSVRAPVGPTNLAATSCAIGRGLAAIRVRLGVDHRFLLYALRATERGLIEQATGTTFAAISGSVVRGHRIPLAPTAEQERIVAAIEEQFSRLDVGIKALSRVHKNLDRLRAAVMQAAVTGRLTREVPTNTQDEASLSSLPRTWDTRQLGTLCKLENGDRGRNYPSPKLRVMAGIPFINAGHLKGGKIDQTEMNYITPERFDLLRAGKVHEGDVLFCLRGSLGKAAIVTGINQGMIASSLVILRPGKEIEPRYLLIYLMSPIAARMVSEFDNGTAQPNLSSRDLARFLVPLPPLDEQRAIVANVDRQCSALDQIGSDVKRLIRRSEVARSSILAAAFAGCLVPQDPNEESASTLLDRIGHRQREMAQSKVVSRKRRLRLDDGATG